ncbi:hypothetical protein IJH19_00630 [Candidatus Saccharibacteria bacterium]|nr:hypothetical protein [Candidatus Saccharibacteria bacterium]
MRQIKHRNKYLRLVASFAIAALALSSVYVPKVSAAENYFTAEGGTLALDDIDPSEPDGRLVSVTLKAAREMVVHSLHGYFTPVSSEDTGLQTFMSWMDYSSGISGICYSTFTGEFDWNTADCNDDVVGDEGIHVQAGDTLIYVTYEVKDGVEMLQRSMPVEIDLAVVDDDKRIENVTMDAYVIAGHDISVYKYITGNGTLDVPDIVIGGTEIEVGIVPDSDYELTYLELNGQDITDEVENGIYKMTVREESLTFYATFRRIYHVLEGDGGEHILGSDEVLAFKIDNDVTEFCDTGVLMIDGEYQDMRTDCEVDPDNQTIILPANVLNALALGEHSFEAWFSEPESGSAKASFKIVEESEEEGGGEEVEEEEEEVEEAEEGEGENTNVDEEDVPVPNTGAFTNKGSSGGMADGFMMLAAIIGAIVAVVTTRVLVRNRRY